MNWWVHSAWHQSPVLLVSWVFWVILSITLHELGHGFAAVSQGDRTPRDLGRLTMNPAVHIPPFGWILFAILGITWGSMPIDPQSFRHGRVSRAFVAFAGPAVNIVLAIVLLTALAFWLRFATAQDGVYQNVADFLKIGGWLNLVLAIFNLLPLPPLDGSAIVAAIVRPFERLLDDPRVSNYAFAALILLGFLGVFGFVFSLGDRVTEIYLRWVLQTLPPLPR